MIKTGVCVICGGDYDNYGHTAAPVKEGLCCEECNYGVVIPRRVALQTLHEKRIEEGRCPVCGNPGGCDKDLCEHIGDE